MPGKQSDEGSRSSEGSDYCASKMPIMGVRLASPAAPPHCSTVCPATPRLCSDEPTLVMLCWGGTHSRTPSLSHSSCVWFLLSVMLG